MIWIWLDGMVAPGVPANPVSGSAEAVKTTSPGFPPIVSVAPVYVPAGT